jgi:acetolactate synthase regulatory subunit
MSRAPARPIEIRRPVTRAHASLDAGMTAAAGDAELEFRIRCAPTTVALARLLSVLHGRGARVTGLQWVTDPDGCCATATIVAGLPARRHPHLLDAVDRIVDVRSVAATASR